MIVFFLEQLFHPTKTVNGKHWHIEFKATQMES